MARGQLGTRVLSFLKENPGPQTVKQIQDGLSAPSGGAIGYALDKLLGEGQAIKHEGRPARYELSDPNSVSVSPLSPSSSPSRKKTSEEISPKSTSRTRNPKSKDNDTTEIPNDNSYDERSVTPQSKRPCGFCMESKPREYHIKYCPMSRVERGDQISRQARSCSCYVSDHDRASDHQEYLKTKSDAPVYSEGIEESRSFRCVCCGNDVVSAEPICAECQDAECEQTTDSSGELGYWNCQIERDDLDISDSEGSDFE